MIGGTIVKARNIVITEPDYGRLLRLVESSRRFRQHDAEHLDDLEQELERAIVVKAGEVPHDVVTINSRVRVKDLNSGRERSRIRSCFRAVPTWQESDLGLSSESVRACLATAPVRPWNGESHRECDAFAFWTLNINPKPRVRRLRQAEWRMQNEGYRCARGDSSSTAGCRGSRRLWRRAGMPGMPGDLLARSRLLVFPRER